MFAVLGVGFAWKVASYPIGTAAHMGPGFFPLWGGILLVLLGVIILARSFSKNAHERRIMVFNWHLLILPVVPWALYKAFDALSASDTVSAFAFKWGPAEFFAVAVLYLTCVAVLASGSLLKAVAMIVLGVLLGSVGTDVNTGIVRFTFGIHSLEDGINPVIVFVGALGIGLWAKLPRSRYRTLFLGLLAICALFFYWRLNYDAFFLLATAAFGAMGYLWTRLKCASAPLFFGFIYSQLLEENFRRALLLSRGDFSIFTYRPLSASLLVASLMVLAVLLFMRKKGAQAIADVATTGG